MFYMNVTTIHNNGKAQIKIGLDSTTDFLIENDGNKIKFLDSANTVNAIQIGGTNGFTITYENGKIKFTSNTDNKPLTIIEPNKGGISGCSYLYSHQDKYDEAPRAVSTKNTESLQEPCKCMYNLPDPTNMRDGTLMIVRNNQWVEISIDDIVNRVIDTIK